MIRKILHQSLRVPLTFKNKATIFNGEFDPSKDYYLILGVSQKAEDSDIKRAYYKLARVHHPDHNANKSDEKFKEINEAYEVLSDVRKRQNYDSSRTFGDFARGFGQKFQSGNVNSQTFNNPFENMSYEDQQKIIQRGRILILRAGLILLGFFVIWNLITRKPNRVYEIVNGELIPVDPRALNSLNRYQQQGGYQQQYYPQQSIQHQQYPQHFQPQPQSQYQYQQPSPNNYGSPYNYTPNQHQQQAYPTEPGYAPSAYAPHQK